ncbi:DUF1579 family protein [Longimicrobium sp.]|uniref:DUF1579 family protein n=1 Tax=Longimicrobium sp. TaxID=2029185 RepID=UPI002BC93CAD|nr:DUF1579 family protein [Longimicrobium sp.]HSU14348.1 DUF1579 family protein [Longimicrobium sp.]
MTERATGQPPARGPEHDALDAFAGSWRTEGALGEGASGAAGTRVTGTESYEWLPGGWFMVNRWDREMGGSRHTGIGVVGIDPDAGALVTRAFDNLGFARVYATQVRGGVMTLTGERERGTVTARGGGLEIHWERTEDGETWLPLCDLAASPG